MEISTLAQLTHGVRLIVFTESRLCPAPTAIRVDTSCTVSQAAKLKGKGIIRGSRTCSTEGKDTNPGTQTSHFSHIGSASTLTTSLPHFRQENQGLQLD